MRTHLSAAALASLVLFGSLSAGCAVDSEGEDVESSEGELGAKITDVTVLDASVSEGSTVSVPYQPTVAYFGEGPKKAVPYLAIELAASPAAAVTTPGVTIQTNGPKRPAVSVAGNFPGSPDVLITDSNFRILAKSIPAVNADLDNVSVTVPAGIGRRFILVRDNLWTKPMTFDVSVGR